MGSLSLHLSNPEVVWRLGEGRFSEPGWSLSWRVHFERFYDHVEVSSGGDLGKMPGSLTLIAEATDWSEFEAKEPEPELSILKAGPTIGIMHFVPAYEGSADGVVKGTPDSYEIRVHVSEAELRTMIERVLAERGPRSVRISAPHIDYGWLPGGEDQKWDVSEKSWTTLDQATFLFGKVPEDDEGEEDVGALPPADPPRSEEADAISALTTQIKAVSPWIMGLLSAILVALLFD